MCFFLFLVIPAVELRSGISGGEAEVIYPLAAWMGRTEFANEPPMVNWGVLTDVVSPNSDEFGEKEHDGYKYVSTTSERGSVGSPCLSLSLSLFHGSAYP